MPDEIRLEIPGGEDSATLDRLAGEDVLGQLLRREGRMRELATEGGDVKLDWVDGVEGALAHPEWLAAVENEAADILRVGIRRVIWAGMGGSVQAVYALCRNGLFAGAPLSVHPLDSTDPASLNRLLGEIAALEGLDLPLSHDSLRRLLQATAMIGVSMGMTSEEPITHLEWFAGLLAEYGVENASEHIQVMTLPGSYLDAFARPRGSRMVPIQLDAENHTAGRMSAPATRVFLRPAALRLVADRLAADPSATFDGSLLAGVLQRAQELSRLTHSLSDAERASLTRADPFVRLGTYLAARADERRNKLVVLLPPSLAGLAPWLEQLVEESLGKGGKGLLVFYDQDPDSIARFGEDVLCLAVRLGGAEASEAGPLRQTGRDVLLLDIPLDAAGLGLGETAALCLGFERMVAVFGYLQGIVFAGQPAVEAYKRYARELREAPGPVGFPVDSRDQIGLGTLTLYYQSAIAAGVTRWQLVVEMTNVGAGYDDASTALAALLSLARAAGRLRYLDLTFNGELTPQAREVLALGRQLLANETLRVPAKLRTGPSDYHSTEQSETDGPNELVSLRLVALEHEPVVAGSYSDKFLLAQARGTWQAMSDAHRWVLMLTFPRLDKASLGFIRKLFEESARLLSLTLTEG